MKFIILLLTVLEFLFSQCQNLPSQDIAYGYAYQGLTANDSDCKHMYNDSGDGLGYYFDFIAIDCSGFCYFNIDDSSGNTIPIDPNTGSNTDDNSNPSTPDDGSNTDDNSNPSTPDDSSNTDNNPLPTTPNTTGHGTSDKVSDLIPYLDEVEYINLEIANRLDSVKSNINKGIDTLNSNTQTINDSLSNVDSTLNKLNSTLGDVSSSLQEFKNSSSSNDSNTSGNSDDSNYDGLGDILNLNPSIDGELSSFESNIKTSITDSFTSYSNVFGLGGYGSTPSNISFSLFGKTYTVFNIKVISPYLEQIRKIFLISAYLFGIFLVFKGV